MRHLWFPLETNLVPRVLPYQSLRSERERVGGGGGWSRRENMGTRLLCSLRDRRLKRKAKGVLGARGAPLFSLAPNPLSEQVDKFHTHDASLPRWGCASDWSCHERNLLHPLGRTTQIWVLTRHQYEISARVSLTSFRRETGSGVTKCRLFTQATCTRREDVIFSRGIRAREVPERT